MERRLARNLHLKVQTRHSGQGECVATDHISSQ